MGNRALAWLKGGGGERQIHPSITAPQRERRVTATFAVIGMVASLAYVVLDVVFSQPALAIACGVSAALCALVLVMLRRAMSLTAARHILVTTIAIAIMTSTIGAGGVDGSMVAWNVLPPLLALMLIGRTSGLTWTVVSLAFLGAIAAIEGLGVTLPEMDPTIARPFAIINALMLIVVVVAFVQLFHQAITVSQAALREAGRALAVQRDLAERDHQEARLVLDHVAEGLAIVGPGGQLTGARSAAFDAWFGHVTPTDTLWGLLRDADPTTADWLELGWEALFEGALPTDVALAQLPRGVTLGGRELALSWVPIESGGHLERVLVVMSDVTAERRASARDDTQREQLEAFRWLVRDRAAFLAFFEQADRLVSELAAGVGRLRLVSALHTLKGNASVFGLTRFAAACHDLEDRLIDRPDDTEQVRAELSDCWRATQELVTPLRARDDDGRLDQADQLTLSRDEHAALLEAARRRAPHVELIARAERLAWERADRQLGWLAAQARAVNARWGDRPLDIIVRGADVRLPPALWGRFFTVSVHLLRNAIVHAFEPPEVRAALGKPEAGTLTLSALELEGGGSVIEVTDDGAGIAWERIIAHARSLGHAVADPDDEGDRLDALFALGVTTAARVTEVAGRGVGLPAVRAACEELGGMIAVESEPGRGTTFRFTFPAPGTEAPLRLSA